MTELVAARDWVNSPEAAEREAWSPKSEVHLHAHADRAASRDGAPARAPRTLLGRTAMLVAMVCISTAGFHVASGEAYDAGSDFAYWLGIIGGVMMLLQFGYSLRKHARIARNWGSMRAWLFIHVVCGIGGPLLILFHSTFATKSLNGRIAFYSMLVVALSGIVGRYVYVRVHHGLSGRRASLKDLRAQLAQEEANVRPLQALAPTVVAQLKAFHAQSFASAAPLARVWRFVAMRARAVAIRHACRRELRPALKLEAKRRKWNREQMRHHWLVATQEVDAYAQAVLAAAQFSAWERIFRLWHLAHIPLLVLLVLSSIAHVIAVHMY